jgi:Outer membrane protein beta-barrel domain
MSGGWRRSLRGVVIVTSLAATTATATVASDLTGTWEAGGGVAYNAYANGSEIKDSIGFEVRGAYHLKNRHGFELNLGFASADSTVSNSDVTYDLTKWTIDYIHELKQKKAETKLAPFLTFGIGQFIADTGDGSSSATVFEGGGGVRVFMAKRFALRFDGKIWHFHGTDPVAGGHWFAFDLAAGVSYFIGGPGK